MKKILFITLLFIVLSLPLSAEIKAYVKEVTGKVYLKMPNETWEPAREGMNLNNGCYISTGFNSRAIIVLGPSILNVKQLTRMRLDELIQKEGTIKTSLFLKVGKVRAQIKSAKGLKHDFKLKSPISTAAVRGTGLEHEVTAMEVFDGKAFFYNQLGQKRTLGSGQKSETTGTDIPSRSEDSRRSNSWVNPFTSPIIGGAGSIHTNPSTLNLPVNPPVNPPTTTFVTIDIDWD